MNILKSRNFLQKNGFTLIEVVIVVIIAGILASVAIPKYNGAIEKSRAAEGAYILGILLSAQERYNLEYGTYTSVIGDLDVTIPPPKNFNPPTVSDACSDTHACANITRTGGGYTLFIEADAEVKCTPDGAGCDRAGY